MLEVNDGRWKNIDLDLILIGLISSSGITFSISFVSESRYCMHAFREGSTLFPTITVYAQLGIASM